MAKGTAVPSLYSHIAHSDDKEETDIPQPFKGVHPKQSKQRGRGKGKRPQQKPKHPSVQIQDDQYNYEDTTIITITRIIEVIPEDVDPIKAKIQVNSLEATMWQRSMKSELIPGPISK